MQGQRKVYLIGIGTGAPEGLTLEAQKCLRRGDVFVGAGRMLEILPEGETRRFVSYRADEIGAYLRGNDGWQRACILLSGDVGFYSGATKLVQELSDFDVELLPGVSSMAAFCARLQIPWEEISFGSIHGRSDNLLAGICRNTYTFSLLGGRESLLELCGKIRYYQMEDVVLHVGEWLGYPRERIVHGTVSEIMEMDFDRLLVVVAENPSPKKDFLAEIPDDAFVRSGDIPMTKSEVRTVSVLKLGLTQDSVLYDIGAGTGSVSIQAGRFFPGCAVYAIEEKPEAVALITENKRKFVVDNVTVVAGHAPEILGELPAPTHVFVGGSGGNLRTVLQEVYRKNPHAVVVMNFVSLEGLAEITSLMWEWQLKNVRMVQLGVARAKEIGNSHLMIGQNPVTIVSIPEQEQIPGIS